MILSEYNDAEVIHGEDDAEPNNVEDDEDEDVEVVNDEEVFNTYKLI